MSGIPAPTQSTDDAVGCSVCIDVHAHLSPMEFPAAPSAQLAPSWPCMCFGNPVADQGGMLKIGDRPFRQLDDRNWSAQRRLEDMDRDGITMQVLSPMPELLSYWLPSDAAAILCDACNDQIASMVSGRPDRFRGLGAIVLQDPDRADAALARLKSVFGFHGVEIGSNINGMMLGDARLDPFWRAAAQHDMAVFVHALHPVAAKPANASPTYTAFSLFPVDVGMAAASIIMAGIPERYPDLRIGFSHGGGTLASIIGRLDKGWRTTKGFDGGNRLSPSEMSRRFFYDSNVYDPSYLRHLATEFAPGQVFLGTDYPYTIMQEAPLRYIEALGLDITGRTSISAGAANKFLKLNSEW